MPTSLTPPKRSVEEAADLADREKQLVSMNRFAAMIGRNRSTISEWVNAKGCPVAREGGDGDSRLLDPKDVWAWREKRIREEEKAKAAERSSGSSSPAPGLPEGFEGGIHPDLLAKILTAKIKQLQLAEKADGLVPRHVAEAAYYRCLAIIREAVYTIPDRIFRKMAGVEEKRKLAWREEAMGQCREALREGAKTIAHAMPSFVPPDVD